MNTKPLRNFRSYGSDPTIGDNDSPHDFYYPSDTPSNRRCERFAIGLVAVICLAMGLSFFV